MSDVKFDAFLPWVLPFAPNCLEVHALIAVRGAAIDFCTESQVLQADMDPVAVRAGQGVYDLEPPSGYRAAHVIDLYCQGRRLEAKAPVALDRLHGRDWQRQLGYVRAYTQFNPDQAVLCLTPDFSESQALTGRLAVAPSRSSDYVDALLLERHVEAIADGALARLLATPDQPYSDPQGALVHATKFRSAKAAARAVAFAGHVAAPLRVALRRKF